MTAKSHRVEKIPKYSAFGNVQLKLNKERLIHVTQHLALWDCITLSESSMWFLTNIFFDTWRKTKGGTCQKGFLSLQGNKHSSDIVYTEDYSHCSKPVYIYTHKEYTGYTWYRCMYTEIYKPIGQFQPGDGILPLLIHRLGRC